MDQHIDVKALRERINWKQDRLALFLGVDRSSISHIENGRPIRGPVRRLLETLAAAADTGTADELCPSPTTPTESPVTEGQAQGEAA